MTVRLVNLTKPIEIDDTVAHKIMTVQTQNGAIGGVPIGSVAVFMMPPQRLRVSVISTRLALIIHQIY